MITHTYWTNKKRSMLWQLQHDDPFSFLPTVGLLFDDV